MPETALLNTERLAKFEAFRATLEPEEQRELDKLVQYVCETIRAHSGHQFGVGSAKELIVALVEHRAGIPRRLR